MVLLWDLHQDRYLLTALHVILLQQELRTRGLYKPLGLQLYKCRMEVTGNIVLSVLIVSGDP